MLAHGAGHSGAAWRGAPAPSTKPLGPPPHSHSAQTRQEKGEEIHRFQSMALDMCTGTKSSTKLQPQQLQGYQVAVTHGPFQQVCMGI